MTPEEYQHACADLARKAIRFAAEKVADEELTDELDGQCERWINVFLDNHLPVIDAAFAFRADVWNAINRMEAVEEETIARGMLSRYKTPQIAMEMAHWHAMDHAEGSDGRARWQRVRGLIERLSKEAR
jgi:hypothetical protein